jgi:hypothetical protein
VYGHASDARGRCAIAGPSGVEPKPREHAGIFTQHDPSDQWVRHRQPPSAPIIRR